VIQFEINVHRSAPLVFCYKAIVYEQIIQAEVNGLICSRETGVCKIGVQPILRLEKRKSYTPRLLRALNEAQPGSRLNFVGGLAHM
jgi:hypothetical protein